MTIRIIIYILLSVLSSFAQTSKSKQSQPSKAETIAWLNNKMMVKPSSPINEDGTVAKTKEWISPDGKKYYHDFTIYKTLTDTFSENPKLSNRNITIAFVSDLNPTSLKVRYYKDQFFISASTTNSEKKIRIMLPTNYSDEPLSDYDSKYVTTLDFGPFDANKESNLEQRMIKALKYLIILSGGKSEAF